MTISSIPPNVLLRGRKSVRGVAQPMHMFSWPYTKARQWKPHPGYRRCDVSGPWKQTTFSCYCSTCRCKWECNWREGRNHRADCTGRNRAIVNKIVVTQAFIRQMFTHETHSSLFFFSPLTFHIVSPTLSRSSLLYFLHIQILYPWPGPSILPVETALSKADLSCLRSSSGKWQSTNPAND